MADDERLGLGRSEAENAHGALRARTRATPRAITGAIVAMAQRLSLAVVAEGIETADQLEHLRQLGCETGQGYYFSKPLPADWMPVLMTMKPRNGM